MTPINKTLERTTLPTSQIAKIYKDFELPLAQYREIYERVFSLFATQIAFNETLYIAHIKPIEPLLEMRKSLSTQLAPIKLFLEQSAEIDKKYAECQMPLSLRLIY